MGILSGLDRSAAAHDFDCHELLEGVVHLEPQAILPSCMLGDFLGGPITGSYGPWFVGYMEIHSGLATSAVAYDYSPLSSNFGRLLGLSVGAT